MPELGHNIGRAAIDVRAGSKADLAAMTACGRKADIQRKIAAYHMRAQRGGIAINERALR